MLQKIAFPIDRSVGTVAVLHATRDQYLMSPRPARGAFRTRRGRLVLDVDPLTEAADAVRLLALDDLEYLRLYTIHDASCAFLARVPSLRRLVLGRNATDESATGLQALPSLRALHLIGSELTDLSLDELAGAATVTHLHVSSPNFTNDAVLRLVRTLPQLEVLQIDAGFALTDDFADALAASAPQRLTAVSFRYCLGVSESAAMRVAARNPGLSVHWLTSKARDTPDLLAREVPWAFDPAVR